MAKDKISFIQSIMDIPMALKGFPKNLTKEPKNAAEFTQCKREHKAYMLLAAIPLIVAVIMMVLQVDEGVSMIFGMVGIGAMIFLLYRMNQIKNFVGVQIEDLTCPQCKEMIVYDENVRYEVNSINWNVYAGKLPTKRGSEANTAPMNVYAKGKQVAEVEVACKCQKCGHAHSFSKSFLIGICEKEQKNVAPHMADLIKLELENAVQKVSHAVFAENKSGQNEYGVSVRKFDLDAEIKNHFNV